MQFVEQLHDRLAILRIEVAGRFAGEQDRRLADQGSGDAFALLEFGAGDIHADAGAHLVPTPGWKYNHLI